MLQVDNTGVHVTHCCLIHGCKYGIMTKDPCPVKLGEVKQEYRCEYCEDEWVSWGRPECGARGCRKPGYWRWYGRAEGTNLAMVSVVVTFYLCDGHDEWHRFDPQWKLSARPMEKRLK